MAMTLRVKISGVNWTLAAGNIGSEKRRKPYPPIFKRMPARITEPAVGASTWASGSQVCTGHIGIFTAKEAKKASQSQVCAPGANLKCISSGIEEVWAVEIIQRMAASISTEPSRV